jgi:hypothetical protein
MRKERDIFDEILENLVREWHEEVKRGKGKEKEEEKVEKEKEKKYEEIHDEIVRELAKEFAEEKYGRRKEERKKEEKEGFLELEKIKGELYRQLFQKIGEVPREKYKPQEKKDYQKELKELEEKFRRAKEIKIMREVIKKARECESKEGEGEKYKIAEHSVYLSPNFPEKLKELSLRDFLLAQMVIAEDYRQQGRNEEAYSMLWAAKTMLDKSKDYILREKPKAKDSIAHVYEMLGKRFVRIAKKVQDPEIGLYCIREAKKCFEEKYKLEGEKL